MTIYLNVLISGVTFGALVGLVSMGFGLFYWVTKIFNLAYGGIFTFAAYVAYQVAVGWKLGIGPGFLAGSLAAAMLSVLIDSAVYQPLTNRGVDRHMILVSGLGVDGIILATCLFVWGGILRYYPPTPLEDVVALGPITVTWLQLLGVAGSVLAYTLLRWMLRSTLVGKSSRALAADAEIAILVGVSPKKVRIVISIVTAVVAAWAAIFQTISLGVHSGMALTVLVMASTGALMGGQNNLTGAFLAGAVLGVLQNVGSFVIGSEWRNSIALVDFLVVLAAQVGRAAYRSRRRTRPAHTLQPAI